MVLLCQVRYIKAVWTGHPIKGLVWLPNTHWMHVPEALPRPREEINIVILVGIHNLVLYLHICILNIHVTKIIVLFSFSCSNFFYIK